MIAKIYTDNENIIFEVLEKDDIPGKLAVMKNSRLGTVIMDTKQNLGITKDAVIALKDIINRADKCLDDLNVLDWWRSQNGTCSMSWIGGNKVVVPKNVQIEINQNMLFLDNEFIEL